MTLAVPPDPVAVPVAAVNVAASVTVPLVVATPPVADSATVTLVVPPAAVAAPPVAVYEAVRDAVLPAAVAAPLVADSAESCAESTVPPPAVAAPLVLARLTVRTGVVPEAVAAPVVAPVEADGDRHAHRRGAGERDQGRMARRAHQREPDRACHGGERERDRGAPPRHPGRILAGEGERWTGARDSARHGASVTAAASPA